MRIRILPLPEERVGDTVTTPYGLILDRIGNDDLAEELLQASTKQDVGARFLLAFVDDVEVG